MKWLSTSFLPIHKTSPPTPTTAPHPTPAVTPSKYRPARLRPYTNAEDDDSENEENDEPRRGARKRAATTHYIPEALPPPRPRAAKQRILAMPDYGQG